MALPPGTRVFLISYDAKMVREMAKLHKDTELSTGLQQEFNNRPNGSINSIVLVNRV